MSPERLAAAFYVLLINCFEEAHAWELPQEVARVFDAKSAADAVPWVQGLLPGLVQAGFVEFSRLAFDAPSDQSWTDVEVAEAIELIAGDEIWTPGQMVDGTVIVATLSKAGFRLLGSLSLPEGVSTFPKTAFDAEE